MIDHDEWTNQIQISIGDSNGGYRLAGPKFNGSQKMILKKTITARDAEEIRRYLDAAFPDKAAVVISAPR